jgi:hypothetical protein
VLQDFQTAPADFKRAIENNQKEEEMNQMKGLQDSNLARAAFWAASCKHSQVLGFPKPRVVLSDIRCSRRLDGTFRCEADCHNGIRATSIVSFGDRLNSRASVYVEKIVRTLNGQQEFPEVTFKVADLHKRLQELAAPAPKPSLELRQESAQKQKLTIERVRPWFAADFGQTAEPDDRTHNPIGEGDSGCWRAKSHRDEE